MAAQGDLLLSIRRQFNWGIVVVGDRDDPDVPVELDEDGFATSGTTLAFAVRHAQDTDLDDIDADERVRLAEVAIDVIAGPPTGPTTFQHVVLVRSGSLSIGDADGVDSVPIESGHCRISVVLNPPERAENVRVWAEQAATRGSDGR
ncbi:hypothetical protein [Rhabdothermincola salaria]|uniref:hypothetical protein n=1 Tax=Rhabdothermincola salaria TaxID=2903142 RepID=UPI001E3F0817|nr:hypothetical protein [Rhabdothermincola salaria]MCD9624070.1 hypothetical protein [Rhabdothermincola salaria]